MNKAAVCVVLLAVFVFYLTFAPANKYLIDIEPIAYSNQLFESFDGPLKHNTILSHAEHLLVNQIRGPESIVFRNGHLYTGTFGGMVVRIDDSKITLIAKIGNGKCDIVWETSKCGRPLGLRFSSKDTLYVVDAYHGLYKIESVDTSQPKATQLLPLSSTKNLKGGASMFFDDITVDEGAGQNGGDVIYISDVSTKWDASRMVLTLIEHDKSGRLLRFDTDSGKVSVVDDSYIFPNGVQITDDKEAILVCELGKHRIIRVFIRGPNFGKREIFTNLPGECDNIRRSASDKESYWVALVSARNSSSSTLFDRLSDKPMIRKFLIRLSYLTGTVIETVADLLNLKSLKFVGHSFKTGMQFLQFAMSNYGMIAEVDGNGKIIIAYSSPEGKTTLLTEVCEVKGKHDERVLYLGSYSNTYLGRLVIKK